MAPSTARLRRPLRTGFDGLRPNGVSLQFPQRLLQIRAQLGERAVDAAGAADQDMVGAGDPGFGENEAGELAKAPLHPVAHDRAADLLRNGDAEADRGIAVLARPDQQDEAGRRRAPARIGGEIVRPPGEASEPGRRYADSFLRPRPRRAAITLRPPTVAIRARKPCRRLRTRLLGWKVRFIAHSSSFSMNKKGRQGGGRVAGAIGKSRRQVNRLPARRPRRAAAPRAAARCGGASPNRPSAPCWDGGA